MDSNNKIQHLTDRIFKEGVEKAEIEAEIILNNARLEADKIIKEAEKKKKEIILDAEKEIDERRRNAKAEINLSLKEALYALKNDITELIISENIEPEIRENFSDKEFIKSIIIKVIDHWQEAEGNADLGLYLSDDDYGNLYDYFKDKTFSQLNAKTNVFKDKKIKSGFTIEPKDKGYKISFNEDGFNYMLKEYLRPKVQELLFKK